MTRTLTLITTLLATLFITAGVATAKTTANTKWLNTKWLNTKWLNTADLNAINGGASFYNPWTGQTLPDVYLDRTTFHSSNGASGDAFVGTWTSAVLGDGTPSYAYIAGRFQPQGAAPETFVYWIYSWAPDDGGAWGWRHACLDSSNNPSPAMPLAGEWNQADGSRISYGGNKFTWACTTGALGKCAASGLPNTLGYAPWRWDWYYKPTQDEYGTWYWTGVDGQRTHQACTRMIRADYCGDGTSRTADGNWIDVADYLWFGQSTETTWLTEAVWNEYGARWISCARWLSFEAAAALSCSNNHYIIRNGIDTNQCLFRDEVPTPEAVFQLQTGIYGLPGPFVGPGKLLFANRTSNVNARPWKLEPWESLP